MRSQRCDLRRAESNGPEQAQRVEGQQEGYREFSLMAYYVYILRLSNGQLYVGSTDDIGHRFAEHQAGSGCRTTALFRPMELVHSELHPDRSSAVKRERQVKRWSRAKKLALINGNLAELKLLAQCHLSSHIADHSTRPFAD